MAGGECPRGVVLREKAVGSTEYKASRTFSGNRKDSAPREILSGDVRGLSPLGEDG